MCDDGHIPSAVAVVPVDPEAFLGEQVPLRPVRRVQITTLVDNSLDVFAADAGPAGRHPVDRWPRLPAAAHQDDAVFDGPVAEHGFSALVEVQTGEGRVHRLLFDTGVSPDGMVSNMRRLGLAPDSVAAVVCSHGHFDHTTGLDGLARALGGPAKLPVVLHPEFWSRRRLMLPGRDPWELPSTSRAGLEGLGFEIIERPEPSFLFDGSVLITGEVPRTTDFERGFAIHQALRNGVWEPDPWILDEQALIVHVEGRGLLVLTGCGHAGVVNIVRYARALTGVEHVHAVVGGFHLTGALFEPVIAPTVEALGALAPDLVVPAHCTGWGAMHQLANRLPSAFVPNTVGTRLDLVAA
ncbi:MBL fold metallo-hydrolase [Microlunatus ginsengisoli]|uniref:MBL fold metallo-hydrolase n=1 Tax=Microlunatus ginsengisoli TaxID=363863 RepID=A0ABP6ZZS6_9ACTN